MRPERNAEPVIRVENLDNEEIEEMINRIRNGENIIQHEEPMNRNNDLEPETKELKEEVLRKMHQIKYMGVEERERERKTM